MAVSGDAKPWTVAQVANGEHIRNALAEGRGHNVGVITNAAITPTVHAAATYRLPVASYAGYPFAYSYPSVYYGKREAEAEPTAEAEADPEADPWLSYYGLGYAAHPYGYGYHLGE